MNTHPSAAGHPVAGGGPGRRLVAVALSEADVRDPGSDLRHVTAAAAEADVLVARVPVPVLQRDSDPLDAPDYPDQTDDDPDVPTAGVVPEPRDALRVHRLGLRWSVQGEDEADLVAALSELIGFDPDERVVCVAPYAEPGHPEITVLRRAVRRVARVYALPVLHYRRVDATSAASPVALVPEPVA